MNFRALFIIFGIILLGLGFATPLSSQALMSMCQKGCWLNGLLLAVFGEGPGKFALGAMFYALGVWVLYLAVFKWRQPSKG
jgi:hypothetical protein